VANFEPDLVIKERQKRNLVWNLRGHPAPHSTSLVLAPKYILQTPSLPPQLPVLGHGVGSGGAEGTNAFV
jgi:hypothetical protein